MLLKLLKLNNVGLFKAACSPAPELSRATVICADNGTGKSTLAAVLCAAVNSDANAIVARRAVDCRSGLHPESGTLSWPMVPLAKGAIDGTQTKAVLPKLLGSGLARDRGGQDAGAGGA